MESRRPGPSSPENQARSLGRSPPHHSIFVKPMRFLIGLTYFQGQDFLVHLRKM
jgi:hypothetical protein